MIPGYHPRLTYGLIAISVLVGLYSSFGANIQALQPFLITYYVDAGLPEVRDGQVWRLVTPIFVHFGFLHIGLNMLWLWQLGTLIEFKRGPWLLAALVVISGVLSNLGEFQASGPLFGGMSGVIFALLAYLWTQGRFNPHFGVRLDQRLFTMVMAFFVICWSGVLGYFGIHIANIAHTIGLLTGALWGYVAAKTRSESL